MTLLSLTASVGDIASDLPGAAEVFRRNGISFCCGGALTLAEAAPHLTEKEDRPCCRIC